MFPLGDSFGRGEPPELPDDRAGWLMQQAVRLLHAHPEEYRQVLDVIRLNIDPVLTSTQRLLGDHAVDPMARWSMIHVLSDVADPGTVGVLQAQATRRLPPIRKEQGICEQAADVEELVNIMAIEALGVLARAGTSEAVDALFDILANQDRRSLRRPALAELSATDPEYRERAAQLLGDEDRNLLDLRVAREDDVRLTPGERDPRRPPPRKAVEKPKPGRRNPPSRPPIVGGD
jgi:hypothetical protein